jgi:hypothetical protein
MSKTKDSEENSNRAVDYSAISNFTQAREYILAARKLHDCDPDGLSGPQYFLIAHAIELLLKAQILAAGGTTRELMKHDVRHSLDALFKRACDLGFAPSDPRVTVIVEMLATYHAGHQFRYRKTGLKTYPAVVDCLETLDYMARAIKPSVDRTIPPAT